MPDVSENRLAFLAEKFNVFDNSDGFDIDGFDDVETLTDPLYGNTIAVIGVDKDIRSYFIEISVFSKMIAADPTKNKMFVQWMLSAFLSLLKKNETSEAIRFACEDLPKAKEYLEIFETNKRKKRFSDYCKLNFSLRGIKDHSNINQYKDLSLLYNAVDPFIEKDVFGLRLEINRYVDMGYADILFKNRNYTVYVPKRVEAAEIFNNFTSWCTSRTNNGSFKIYTDKLRPDKSKSLLYVVIPTTFLDGHTDEIYQIHFEEGQFMAKNNTPIPQYVISDLDTELLEFIRHELLKLIPKNHSVHNNKYYSWAMSFGLGHMMFDFMEEGLTTLRFIDRVLLKMPDSIARFKNMKHIAIVGCKLKSVSNAIGNLDHLEILSLNNNPIKSLPSTIGKLKKLKFLGLVDVRLSDLPSEISALDTSNGGSLSMISANDPTLISKIRDYLPNAKIIT